MRRLALLCSCRVSLRLAALWNELAYRELRSQITRFHRPATPTASRPATASRWRCDIHREAGPTQEAQPCIRGP